MTHGQHSASVRRGLLGLARLKKNGGKKGKKETKTLPQYIFFSPSLFTEAVVCDRNSGRSQVPWKLTIFFLPLQTSANIYPPIYWHAALWMHSPAALDFNLHTNEEKTSFHEWRWLLLEAGSVCQGQTPTAFICSQNSQKAFLTPV